MVEVYKSTQDSSCSTLLKNGTKLSEENQRLLAKVKEQENAIELHLQTSTNVATLKDQLQTIRDANEVLTDQVKALEKENGKLKAELKETRVFT